MKVFGSFPLPKFKKYKVVAKPEGNGEGFWIGGCSSLMDKDGKIWLVYRVRNPQKRGYKVCIATSSDGTVFRTVNEIYKEDIEGALSLERASLLQDPTSRKYRLYLSLESSQKKGYWFVCKFKDTVSPEKFSAQTAQPVFLPSSGAQDSRKVKDPYIFRFVNIWHMVYSGSGEEPQEEAYLAISQDGVEWIRWGRVFRRGDWHDYHTRISCIIPTKRGFVFLYEGSSSSWYKPHFNLQLGYGYTVDMRNFFNLTPKQPVLSSPTGGNFSTIRYIDYLFLKDKVLFYYEAARDDGAFELRVSEGKIWE